ncbi:MAG: DNA/RNA nuclease SfsA [Pseudomonadota bacterium]
MALGMGELGRGELVRRYKRFLADVRLADGRIITIHCPNTGSMKNCADPGDEVFFSTSTNPARKYPHTWEFSRTSRGHIIGINTHRANALVRDGIECGVISELGGYARLAAEVRYESGRSRADFWLGGSDNLPDCFVEVKSVTLLESPIKAGIGFFPDAVSERASRHLADLQQVVQSGGRALLCFCVQHSGIREVRPAVHIDPIYARTLNLAIANGVEVIAYKARITPREARLVKAVPVVSGE